MKALKFEIVCHGKTFTIRIWFEKEYFLDFPIVGRIESQQIKAVRLARGNIILAHYNIIPIHMRPADTLIQRRNITPRQVADYWQSAIHYFSMLKRQAVRVGVAAVDSENFKNAVLATSPNLENFKRSL